MYHHFDHKNQLFIMRYMHSHLHKILWLKMLSDGGFSSKLLSHLHHSTCYMQMTIILDAQMSDHESQTQAKPPYQSLLIAFSFSSFMGYIIILNPFYICTTNQFWYFIFH